MNNCCVPIPVDPFNSFLPDETDRISLYEIELSLSGRCPVLLPCGFLSSGSTYQMVLPPEDFCTLAQRIKKDKKPPGGHYNNCLMLLVSVVQAVICAGEYMIPEDHLSLCPDHIFFPETEDVSFSPRLILMPGTGFSDAIRSLCLFLYDMQPLTHADRLEAALRYPCADHLSPRQALHILQKIRRESGLDR